MKPLQNLAFASILFLLMSSGCSRSKDNVTVYNHTALGLSCNITFNNDCPTYGLPVAEYAILVELLGKGDVEEAKRKLNMFLDLTVDDAMSEYGVGPHRYVASIILLIDYDSVHC